MKIHFNTQDLEITPEQGVRLLSENLIIEVIAQLPNQQLQQELALLEAYRRTCELEDDFMAALGCHVQQSLIISAFLN